MRESLRTKTAFFPSPPVLVFCGCSKAGQSCDLAVDHYKLFDGGFFFMSAKMCKQNEKKLFEALYLT